MSYQLSMNESSNIITDSIKWVSENLNRHLTHTYSKPANQGFYVEISDFDLEVELNKLTKDYYKDDHTFTLNIPYEYFNEDALPEDSKYGVTVSDNVETKATIRCMELITRTYQEWIKTHEPFSTKDLQKIINQALEKLRTNKHIDLNVRGNGNEFAEKYINIWFTWAILPSAVGINSNNDHRWFGVTFTLADYFDDVGNNSVDGLIGESYLYRLKDKKSICLLRITYILYQEAIGFLKNKWPHIYQKLKTMGTK